MDRSNHYEAAFEGYLQWHRLCYVGVDESRRSYLGDERVKSLDFIVHGDLGQRWLVDVKGRRFPGGTEAHPKKHWECWSTRADVDGLKRWTERFGPGYQGLLLFAYQVMPFAPAPPPDEELWTWQGRRYLLRGIGVEEYQAWMRVRSPKWDTIDMPTAAFQRLARPFSAWLKEPAWHGEF